MKVESFEDLNIYQQARELTNKIYAVTRNEPFARDYGLVDQIRRASVSIMSNIAEGFERENNTEFIYFLYIAKGSCGEIRAQLTVALDQKYIDGDTCKDLIDRCRKISGMLNNLITYLKDSKFKGTKFKKPPVKPWSEQVKELLERTKNKPLNS